MGYDYTAFMRVLLFDDSMCSNFADRTHNEIIFIIMYFMIITDAFLRRNITHTLNRRQHTRNKIYFGDNKNTKCSFTAYTESHSKRD